MREQGEKGGVEEREGEGVGEEQQGQHHVLY